MTLKKLFDFKNCFFLLYVCFKIVTWRGVASPIDWNVQKKELQENENHTDLRFYLAFPTGIYLLKINYKKQKETVQNMSEVNKKGTWSNLWNLIFTNVLFSIILTSLYVISTAKPTLFTRDPDCLHFHPDSQNSMMDSRPNSRNFLHFHPAASTHSDADSPHSHPISHILTPILRISLVPLPNSLMTP